MSFVGVGKQFKVFPPTKLTGNLGLLATGMPLLRRTAYHQAVINRETMHSSFSTLRMCYTLYLTQPLCSPGPSVCVPDWDWLHGDSETSGVTTQTHLHLPESHLQWNIKTTTRGVELITLPSCILIS